MNWWTPAWARSTAGIVVASALLLIPAAGADAQDPGALPLRLQPGPRPAEPEIRGWQDLWRHVWERSAEVYEIGPAPAVRGVPQCPDDLGIGRIVEETILAVSERRFGDAARHMGEFQERLYCPDWAGVRGIEYALAAFVHLALEELPSRDRATAVRGAFNLGLLAFDQLLYTGRSWWLPVMHVHRESIRAHLARYPGRELGLWVHHLPSGSLVAFPFDPRNVGRDPLTGPLLAAFAEPARFGSGECTLLGQVRTSFRCAGGDPLGGGVGGGAGGAIGGAAGEGMTACAIAAALAAGHGGAMRCAVAAGGGGGIRTADHGLHGPIVRGVLDEQCALRTGGSEDYAAQRESFEENFEQWKLEFEEQMAWIRQQWAQADIARRQLEEAQARGEARAREAQALAREARLQAQLARLHTELAEIRARLEELEKAPGGGGAGEMRPDGGDACADATNAAERVASMYACVSGQTGARPPIGDPREPVTLPGPGQIGGAAAPSGLLGCHLQGGSLVRGEVTDGRCSVTTCPQGSDSCSCDAPRDGRATPPLGNWMGARELLFFEHGGGLTDPPRPDVRREREIRTPLRAPTPPQERELSGMGWICPPAALRE